MQYPPFRRARAGTDRRSLRRPAGGVAAAAALALALTGLAVPAQAAETYDVEIRVTGEGQTTGAGTYAAGETVQLDAMPAAGNVWGGWTSEQLDWLRARLDSFTMPASDVVIDTSFRPQARPLKEVYDGLFQMGNIWSGPQTYEAGSPASERIERDFEVMTAENAMKPESLLPNANIDDTTGAFTFNWGEADRFVDETIARGSTVHGHVLVWHGQSPPKLNSGTTGGTRELARENMRRYIQEVLTHFSGRVPTWDVVNEAFVDGLESFDPETQNWEDFLRGGPNGGQSNWYTVYSEGADVDAGESAGDFIYDAFVFARQYGPEVNLQYNDFNMFQSAGKGRAAVTMAKDLNARYAAEYPEDPRPLIETIGMQSHNYINQTPAFACGDRTQLGGLVDEDAESWQAGACSNAASVEATIQQIIDAGLKVAISELDLMVWEAWNAEPETSNAANYRDLNDPEVRDRISRGEFTYWVDKISHRAELEEIQAQRFAEYFSVYTKYADAIDRVTFWGLNDQRSWRATHNPLLLNGDWSEKLAMWAVSDPQGWYDRDAADGDGIPIEATVPEASEPGSLSLTVADYGDGVKLDSAQNAGDRLRFTGSLPTITVTDSRNDEQASDGGWSTSGQSTSLVSGERTLTADHLGWTPKVLTPRPGVTAGAWVPTVLSNGPGLATAQRLAAATADGRYGSTQLSAGLVLDVPVGTAPGTYRGTLTVSLFPVD
ncbi:endo-1,4-beta-xylanase [Microbacterium sp. zg.Y625]|uniref:endo-1,4-beta-xylanase n=1 Tax=Microbacterium jiangjiandongii TaxID=3049071 RepID=UPI00214C9A8D|nr:MULTISPECIES: endo-1,4-beta-xylanase [unclassified Microbacterium]MCR2794038.1 endo-1,4-beta-xylanase [Microbacterium sp. zg.Y625]WIM25754.1 endo-1,4-beta-xylanase [Microbacterium sp. zg-Y625]